MDERKETKLLTLKNYVVQLYAVPDMDSPTPPGPEREHDKYGGRMPTCVGFRVGQGYVLTAAHCQVKMSDVAAREPTGKELKLFELELVANGDPAHNDIGVLYSPEFKKDPIIPIGEYPIPTTQLLVMRFMVLNFPTGSLRVLSYDLGRATSVVEPQRYGSDIHLIPGNSGCPVFKWETLELVGGGVVSNPPHSIFMSPETILKGLNEAVEKKGGVLWTAKSVRE